MFPDAVRAGHRNSLEDVTGLRVGHAQRIGDGYLTGTTVILAPDGGMTAGVDIRGGGPATRETDALDPRNLVPRIDAIVLTGGSAYGLAAADGVTHWLEEHGRGFPVGINPGEIVPVVPTAGLFDLGRGGDFKARPDAALGRAAAEAAEAAEAADQQTEPDGSAPPPQGGVGAGTGALMGGVRAGVGTASVYVDDTTIVSALVVSNAFGSAVDPRTGLPYGLTYGLDDEFRVRTPSPEEHRAAQQRLVQTTAPANTVIGVVATNAALDRSQARKLAGCGHDGLARAVRPAHTLFDGDTLFGLATGEVPLPEVTDDPYTMPLQAATLSMIYAAGADVVARAIVHSLLAATPITTPSGHLPTYRELYPTATA